MHMIALYFLIIFLLGSLGDVMKESANIAHTYAKYFIEKRDPTNTFLSTADIRCDYIL